MRKGIHLLTWDRHRELNLDVEELTRQRNAFIDGLKRMPIALVPELANSQHYEVPSEFFQLSLGARLKYSCCLFAGSDNPYDSPLSLDQVCLRDAVSHS